MTQKILFVCDGNTCRSPMAEMIAKDWLKYNNIKGVKVNSCGIATKGGDAINEYAKQALKLTKVKCTKFVSKSFNTNLAKDSLVVAMTEVQFAVLIQYTECVTLGQFNDSVEIEDPYGSDLIKYLKCVVSLKSMIDKMLTFIYLQ